MSCRPISINHLEVHTFVSQVTVRRHVDVYVSSMPNWNCRQIPPLVIEGSGVNGVQNKDRPQVVSKAFKGRPRVTETTFQDYFELHANSLQSGSRSNVLQEGEIIHWSMISESFSCDFEFPLQFLRVECAGFWHTIHWRFIFWLSRHGKQLQDCDTFPHTIQFACPSAITGLNNGKNTGLEFSW